jgi:protein-disulfide isomerase
VFARSTLITLEQEYVASGRVLLAFRNLPIEKLHPLAFKAAEAAECAGRQDRFWQMHDLLFRNQEALDQPSLVADAKALQLDTARFLGCLSGQVTDQVRKDRDSAQALLITGTPTFLLGVKQSDGRVKVMRRLSGAQPIDQFKTALGVVLSETR